MIHLFNYFKESCVKRIQGRGDVIVVDPSVSQVEISYLSIFAHHTKLPGLDTNK